MRMRKSGRRGKRDTTSSLFLPLPPFPFPVYTCMCSCVFGVPLFAYIYIYDCPLNGRMARQRGEETPACRGARDKEETGTKNRKKTASGVFSLSVYPRQHNTCLEKKTQHTNEKKGRAAL